MYTAPFYVSTRTNCGLADIPAAAALTENLVASFGHRYGILQLDKAPARMLHRGFDGHHRARLKWPVGVRIIVRTGSSLIGMIRTLTPRSAAIRAVTRESG